MSIDLVEIVLTEADDPRLKGWLQTTGLRAPATTRVKVDAVLEPDLVEVYGDQGVPLAESWLCARVSASENDGPFEPWTFVFFERPRVYDLRTLESLAEVFRKALNEPLPTQFDKKSRWSDTWPEFEPLSTQVIFDQLVALRVNLAEAGEREDRLTALADKAYALGRMVRQEEIAARFGAQLFKSKAGAVRGGKTTGAVNAKAAETWRRPFAIWLQAEILLDPISLDEVLERATEEWPSQGFGRQKSCPSREALKTAIRWAEKQNPPLFTRARAKAGRKKSS